MSSLILPRLLSDGAVIQRRKSIHIWGWDKAGARITVKFDNDTESAICDENGRFDAYLSARESGGPYILAVSDDNGNIVIVKDILVGLVWLCTGQSNMELPMARCADEYPKAIENDENDRIRTFKIVEETCYKGPLEEHNSGSWKSVRRDTIRDFSATAYFFAKNLQSMTGQPVGIINASLGGSRIYSWMSREMLEGYDELLAETNKYADESFYNDQIKRNLEKDEKWHNHLVDADLGINGQWDRDDLNTEDWKEFDVPGFFKGTELDGFVGSVWFRRSFDLPAELAGRQARLFMGTMVDSDTIYVNGECVGETAYQYPPRKYNIPMGLTREKDNTIAIRLCVESGMGRFTEGKELKIFNSDGKQNLDGKWKYKIGAKCEPIMPTDFVNWKPTGLFNAMTAPCANYPIDGVIWYQGESNIEDDYADLTERMVKGYRQLWKDDNLPFIATQLPNFVIDQLPLTDDWGRFRLKQNKILNIPMTGLAVTLGLGEDNDLHPTAKEPIGHRLSLWAMYLKYGFSCEYTGPMAENAVLVDGIKNKSKIKINLTHSENIQIIDLGKGTELEDFYITDLGGKNYKARAEIDGDNVVVECDISADQINTVRYCCENTYHGGLITNVTWIPMSPFELTVDKGV